MPDLPNDPNPMTSYLRARARSIEDHEHIKDMLLFFCQIHYPKEQAIGECPGSHHKLRTQGAAQDWLKKETKLFKERVGLGSKPIK